MRRFIAPFIFFVLLFSLSTAAFSYTITVNYDPAMGSVTQSPEGSPLPDSTEVTLTASPITGFVFDGWYNNSTEMLMSAALTMVISLNNDIVIDAKFFAEGGGGEESVSMPMAASGPSEVDVNDVVVYESGFASSSLGHPVEYGFDWGDGSAITWGDSIQSHAWTISGQKEIFVTARCVEHTAIESMPSGGYMVMVNDTGGGGGEEYIVLEVHAEPPEGGDVSRDMYKPLYAEGDQVLLTANPNRGYKFSHWEDGDNIFETQSLSVTLYEDRKVYAHFVKDDATYFQILTDVSPTPDAGMVNLEPYQENYAEGDSVKLIAAEFEGYRFSHWSGDIKGDDNPYELVVSRSIKVIANYEDAGTGEELTLDIEISPPGMGTVKFFPEWKTFPFGEPVTLEAFPTTGYMFIGWGGDADGMETKIEIRMDSNKRVIAYFAEEGDPGGEPGEEILPPATANKKYYYKLITGNPDDTYELYDGPEWLELERTGELGGTPAAADEGYAIPVIVIVYETSGTKYEKTYFIDVLPEGGTVEPGDEKLPPAMVGIDYYFMITGHPIGTRYKLVDGPRWMMLDGDSGIFSGIPSETDIGVDMPIQVLAGYPDDTEHDLKFFIDVLKPDDPGDPGELTLSIEVSPPGMGTVRFSPEWKTFPMGEPVTLEAFPTTGYMFIGWGGDAAGIEAKIEIRMDSNKHVIATFAPEGDPGGEPGEEKLPPATVNIPYNFKLFSKNADDTFEMVDGPGWLKLERTGVLSGTPSANDVGDFFLITVLITEITGSSYKAEFMIDVMPSDGPVDPGGEPGDNELPPAVANKDYIFNLPFALPGYSFEKIDGPEWLKIDRVSGQVSGFPISDDVGNDFKVVVRVNDPVGGSEELVLSIDVLSEGEPGDPGGEPGEHELPPAIANIEYFVKLPFALPGYTFEIIDGPEWLKIDRVSGQVSGFPISDDVGNDFKVVMRVNDPAGGSEEYVLSIDVYSEGEPGGEPGEGMLPPAVVNRDYYFMLPNQNPGDTFDLIRAPGWMKLDPVSGVFGGMPAAADEGFGINVIINIKDATGNVKEVRLMLDVYPDDDTGGPGEETLPPAIANMEYYFMIPGRSPEDTFELIEGPGWMRINKENGQLGGMPKAADVGDMLPVKIVIYDAAGAPFELNMTIDVYLEGDSGVPGEKFLPPAFANMEYYFMLPDRNPGDTFKIVDGPQWLKIDSEIGLFGGMPTPDDVGFGIEVIILVTSLTGDSFKDLYMMEVLPQGDPDFEPGEKYLPPAIANMKYIFKIPFGGPEDKYELVEGPEWMRLDPELGELRGMPAAADVANGVPVVIKITNVTGDSFDEMFMLDVYPDGGDDGSMELPSAVVNEPYYFMFPGRSPDDTFELVDGPGWLMMDKRTGQMTGMPMETDIGEDIPIVILITGPDGEGFEAKLFINVYPEGSHGGEGLPAAFAGVEYKFFLPDDNPDAKYELVIGPDWLKLDPDIGEFTGIPTDADIGEGFRVEFTISLRTGEIFEKSTTIDVYPEGGPSGDMYLPPAIAGIEYDFMIPRENIDDTFEIIDGPEWLKIDYRTGQFGGMPPDSDVGMEHTVTILFNGESARPYEMKFILEVFPFGRNEENHLPPATANMEYYFMVPKFEVEGDIELISGPEWLKFDTVTRTFGGMPTMADVGMDFPVVVKITDPTGASFEETLMIEVFPEGGPVDEMFLPAAIANMPYYFKIPDLGPDELLEIIDGPGWLELDPKSGQLSGLPSDADVGYDIPVTFQITEADQVFKETLMIDVLPEGGAKGLFLPPATVNMPYDYKLPMRNPDDKIEIVEGPPWLRFDPRNASLSGIPSKDDVGFGIPVTILITEASGDSYKETLLLEVFHTGGPGGEFLPPATVNMQYYFLIPDANPGDTFEIIKGPGWLMIDKRTAQMTGMPAATDVGYGITVTILITSAEGEVFEEKLMLDVFPEGGGDGGNMLPPAIANMPYDHMFPKRHADDVIEVIDSPDWLRIDTKSGQMHGIPSDADVAYGIPVTVKIIEIIDSSGEGYEETFMLDVFPSGDFGGMYLPPATVNARYEFMVPMKNPDDVFTIGEGPEWLKADPETGSLIGTPAATDIGYGIPVTLLITGTQEIVHKETFMLDVIPEGGAAGVAGMFLPPATATVPYDFTLPKKNPDDTFEIGDGPAWLSVEPKTGILSGTPAETDVGYGIPVTLELRMSTGESRKEMLILDVFSAEGPKGIFLPPATVNMEYEFKVPKNDPEDVFEIVEGPEWLSIYPKSGLMTGIPAETDVGFGIPVTLSASNRLGESYTENYLINVLAFDARATVNYAPNFATNTLNDAYESAKYLEVLYVSDENLGERFSYRLITGPDWLTINNSNGQLSGIPLNDDVGTDIPLSIVVTDAGELADTLSTSITVINVENPPVFLTRKLWDATNGIAYSDTIEVSDPDGETSFTFEKLSGPAWLSIDNSGILSGTPGTDDVGLKIALSITATDGTGLSGTFDTSIHVLSETRIESVVIDQTERVVRIGGTMQYSAQVMTNFGTVAESAPVHWSVVGDVGTIDDNGLFTAVKGGVGYIEASTTVVDKLISSRVAVTVFLENYKLASIKTGAPIYIDDVTYPLDFMKGAKLNFSNSSLPEEIKIDIKLPSFAKLDNDNKKISYDNNIIFAITFDVLVDDEAIGTYYFNEPIQISIPYDPELLRGLGLSPNDLRIFYVTDTGELIGDEIYDVVVDSLNGFINAYVSHFSNFAFVSKYDGPTLVGDFDYDMEIDFYDFVQLITYWNAGNQKGDIVGKASGENKAGAAPWWSNTYLYPMDGVVDFEDFTAFALMYNWYQTQNSETVTKPKVVAKKAKTNKTFGLKWDEKEYAIGDTLTISMDAGYIDDFVAAEIVLNYDTSLLKVCDVTSSFASGEYNVMTPVQFKASNGNLRASTIALGDLREGVTITGQNIFEIDFEVIGKGELNIELTEIDMRNHLNNAPIFKIDNILINGTVGESHVPLVFELSQNYPNPFNMRTTINYSIDMAGRTNIDIYNTLGQKVRTLVNENLDSGRYTIIWNGTDNAGLEVSSGVYIITMRNNKRFDTKQILMLK
ncbi:putative Ig domain-containing protein [Candidatus Latescibacterota bacterium]